MLSEFLLNYRKEILAITEDRLVEINRSTPLEQIKTGLPLILTQLMTMLEYSGGSSNTLRMEIAFFHSKELIRLGLSMTELTSFFEVICKSINELSKTTKFSITDAEFYELDLCLDIAIANTITEFSNPVKRNLDSSF